MLQVSGCNKISNAEAPVYPAARLFWFGPTWPSWRAVMLFPLGANFRPVHPDSRFAPRRQIGLCISPDGRERCAARFLQGLQGTCYLPRRQESACVLHSARKFCHGPSARCCGKALYVLSNGRENGSEFVILAIGGGIARASHCVWFGRHVGHANPARLPPEFSNRPGLDGSPGFGTVPIAAHERTRLPPRKQHSR
jgi:hypothetical protein